MKTFIYIVLITAFPVILQGQYTWGRHSISATGGEQNTSTYTTTSSMQHYEANSISSNSYNGSTGFLFPEIILLDIKLDASLYLEGPFNGTTMNTDLYIQNHIPLSQPYNTTPWNYTGAENVPAIPNAQVVDWVLVELRDAADASLATPANMIDQQAAFLLDDGSIVDLDGSSILSFEHLINHSLFIVIWHRNHLGVMSAVPLNKSNGIYSFDFTNALSQAHNDGQKNLGGGYFGMTAGNSNSDGVIDQNDKIIWSTEAGDNGYLSSDNNLNGQVNNQDKNDSWYPNNGGYSQIPD